MKIEKTKSFLRSLKGRSDIELQSVGRAMHAATEAFGQPHRHTGISIRRLGKNLFECRAGLDLRLLFMSGPGILTFKFAGTHDDVQAYLKR